MLPPNAVTGLIDIALLRNKAAAVGITEVTSTPIQAILHTTKIEEQVAARLSEEFGENFIVSVIGAPTYVIRLRGGLKLQDVVARLSKVL